MKKIFFAAAALLLAVGASAQENGNRDAQNKIVRGPYETNRFFDNIFIGVAGGVNVYAGENDSYGSFGKRLAPALDINVGKWITPSVGLRLGYSGVNAKGWTTGEGHYTKESVGNGIYKEKFGVAYIHSDLLWNFSNAVSGYKETRTWNFVPFVGFGYVHSYGNDTTDNELGFSLGLLNNIRVCDLLDITLEARRLYTNERLDGVARGSRGEGMWSLTAGLSFKLNRRGFVRAQKPDYAPYLDRIEALEKNAADLNSRNQKLAGENGKLADENERLRKAAQNAGKVETKVVPAPYAVFFKIGTATLDKKELANLESYVKHAVKTTEGKVFLLTGSADSQTGTPAFNQRLSEKRVEYVYNKLVNEYGIPADRLETRAVGGTTDYFKGDPELNRAVIIE